MSEKKLSIMLGSENSGGSFQTVYQFSNRYVPEIGIQVTDEHEGDSAWQVVISYEGGGAFSIRSQKGSRITIRGGRTHEPLASEEISRRGLRMLRRN